ncbi:TolB family protein [Pseudofrankia inefficax]|uniref:WD40-like beta Propeller containing protein n=1 Tax=Pseudofrankia inefficax (strain DSM 45817 / CECT 9037 / DDB 130130 / EuI1c) TaxID=298654 RepID=E3J6A7_PSEI1|nr:hypothetical protein [Pseudofrankia inefficax]ADP79534.1 hypothetical protein FraEuI1c_1471 [Pseudofrankia inefficax]
MALMVAVAACSSSGSAGTTGAAPSGINALPEVVSNPPAPKPEPISVSELPLPPVTTNTASGGCTVAVNPHGTGCIGQSVGLQSGGYLPDGHAVSAMVSFAGAPAAPDPASVYAGPQIIIVRTDGTTFPGGDAWKCVTCGVPAANQAGRNEALDYPQPFNDGKRILAGTNVIDCGSFKLADTGCAPGRVHVYPVRFNNTADGSGKGGSIRELRLNPDNVHLGFNSFTFSGGAIGQFGYLGRLTFNPNPTTGTPLAARYDLTSVTRLFDTATDKQTVYVDPAHPGQLTINRNAISVGELRGFSKDGKEVTYIGYPDESSNIDVFAADLTTGKVRRLTSNPEYTDPIDLSPDGDWTVAMDTRGSDRQEFLAGMRGIPPITDLVTPGAVSSVRNNGTRRFFQPILIDRYGDRGTYQGQQINAAGDGSPGAVNDPNWNGEADPRWSPDGTAVVYWQALATPPACGGANPLTCETSTEPGGRTARLMIATFTSRKPAPAPTVAPISDTVPWGTPYVPGSPIPTRPFPPTGSYTLAGAKTGTAAVTITENAAKTAIDTIAVRYTNYSDDGLRTLNGTEKVTAAAPSLTVSKLDWYSDLTQTGITPSTKKTSPDGFHLTIDLLTNDFQATGTMTTTINGHAYHQPQNST